MKKINPEKEEIIDEDGNILVTANPGTGKTLLLAHKYIDLIDDGLDASDILCLTFTVKARKEMEDRITKIAEEKDIDIDPSELNIHTFHSYAKRNILEDQIISPNMLRYTVYDYLKENNVLSYGDRYIVNTIVPKLENLLRYIKTHGILPEDIDIEKTKKILEPTDLLSKEEMDTFAEELLNIYREYEEAKKGRGIDYSDLLLNYLKLPETEKFKYVLVDELQDVNELEADIALESGERFIAVGDPKQAIFGFQGGSIENFKKFKDSSHFVLSENFRSTDQILRYAREHFKQNTEIEEYKKELKDLHSAKDKKGPKPKVHEFEEEEEHQDAVCTLAENLVNQGKEVAIITRTNHQINDISKEMENRDIDFNINRSSASDKARENIVKYIKGLLSNDVEEVKQALFTPFSPVELRKAFEITEENDLTLEKLEEKAPEMKKAREEIENVEHLNDVFTDKIIPVSICHGEEYLLAASTLQKAYQEFLQTVEDKTLKNLEVYLKSTDLLTNDSTQEEGEVVITTVHKAKGREFNTVIYVPKKTRGNTGFWDKIGEKILETKGIKSKEELEEEPLRIHFVGMTRAEEQLHIIPSDLNKFENEYAETNYLDVSKTTTETTREKTKKAFNLFVNEEYQEAKKLLETNEEWLYNTVKNHFKNLDHLSYSSIKHKPTKYLKDNILELRRQTRSLSIGSRVHTIAEQLTQGKDVEVEEELQPYKENIQKLLKEIKKDYPEALNTEECLRSDISEIMDDVEEELAFTGFLDAAFKNKDGEHLIVDWKTSSRKSYSTEHRRQLGIYRRMYSQKHDVPIDKVKTAVGYVGLENRVKTGKPKAELLENPASDRMMKTLEKRTNKILKWKNNPSEFFQDLEEEGKEEDPLVKSIIEQYHREKQ